MKRHMLAGARNQRLKTTGGMRVVNLIAALLLAFFFLLIVFPALWMLLSSFKNSTEVFTNLWGLPQKWLWSNYVEAWNTGMARYFINSVLVTLGTVFLTLTLCSLYAFALTMYRFKGKKLLYLLAMGGMMVSPIVSMIPLYQEIQALHLYNNLLALILVYTAFQFAMSFLLIYAFFTKVDPSFPEAAKLDGCNALQILRHVYLPISKPILITCSVLSGFYAWNEFAFSLIFIKDNRLKTIPVGLLAFQGEMHSEWGVMLAGLTLFSLPIILFFIFAQKSFVSGLAAGGVKG